LSTIKTHVTGARTLLTVMTPWISYIFDMRSLHKIGPLQLGSSLIGVT